MAETNTASRSIFLPHRSIGNVSGHKHENTYCPNCGEKLVKRYGYYILKYEITEDKRCPKRRTQIPITGQYAGK